MSDFPNFDVQGKVWSKTHNPPLTANITRGVLSPDFALQQSLKAIKAQKYMTQAWKPYTYTRTETPAIKELREMQEKKMNREAAATNTFYKALEEGDYATARNMINEYPALGAVFASKMGALKFRGSQQTSMQAALGRTVASEKQDMSWRKTYRAEGLSSVSGYLNAQEVTYLALYGCVITAMLQQILNITNSEITVAQYEQLMDKALSNKNLFTTRQRKRDENGKIMRNENDKALYKKVDYDRSQFGETYNVVDGASTAQGETEYDIDVYRGALASFYLKELQNLGVDTSGIKYVTGQNINDYLQDYDVYASVRSGGRQHDYGVYIPKTAADSWTGSVADYYRRGAEGFQDPLNWKDSNLQNADIQGFFIRR